MPHDLLVGVAVAIGLDLSRAEAARAGALRLLRATALTQIAQERPLGGVSKFPREPKNETSERQNSNLPEHQK
jgi:hypothetical protein